jgi:cytochrome c2
MPALFPEDRRGFVERWVIADVLARDRDAPREDRPAEGDHRKGRRAFLGLGCAACHLVPDLAPEEQGDPGRVAFEGLGDRLGAEDLAAFLGDPRVRYPEGRMPRLPLTPEAARDVAAYLLLWSKPAPDPPDADAPTAEEIADLVRRLGVPDRAAAAKSLLHAKGCRACHTGLGPSEPLDVPLGSAGSRGCLADGAVPHYRVDAPTRAALAAYLAVAARETHPSPIALRQGQLERAGCVRCHQRDSDRPPPIERIGSSLGGANLQTLPYQRTPRLTEPHQKYTRTALVAAVRDGVSGLRPADYSYRMPAYGTDAEALVRALAEADGELPCAPDPPPRVADDPTVGTLMGPDLVGPRGYSCISCHVWDGRQLSMPDPGAVGPDLTRVAGRLRRDWFDRFLEGPERSAPGTPMPTIFVHGRPATLTTVLGGDPAKQKDALWSYFALGRRAPAPQPPPPLPVGTPAPGAPPLVAQIPIRPPGGGVVEGLCLLTGDHDLLIYDLAAGAPHGAYTGARIVREVQGRGRRFLASGTPAEIGGAAGPALPLVGRGRPEEPVARELLGYDRLADGVRIRWRVRSAADSGEIEETLRIVRDDAGGRLARDVQLRGLDLPERVAVEATVRVPLPPGRPAPAWEGTPAADPGPGEGARERPGYRAVAYPRPRTASGEDRVMPAALAVHPRDGRVFVASLKTGELFVLRDPDDDGRGARFEDYAHGLFQDAFALRAEEDALYVLHRRNLTRVADTDGDGQADRFDRVAALPHGVADTYDYAYGLVRDEGGGFLLSYAPYANTGLPGSGGVLRLVPGGAPREVAFGLRNPLGWCNGPGGAVFFTDNQGEWVAANKLCHLEEGRFYGFPNPAQRQHAARPAAKAAVWVPYGWARSINGVAYDGTGGRFGPFAGQFFLAELMFGGALLRADVERVNGQYQGACFPFWGPGLLGPVSLAFDPKGRLFVGGITEPGWMAQPDRGALFRIDFTGRVPFEMRSIRVRPRGFRIAFTAPADPRSAAEAASYRLEHYRYESTGAYGSPELDRTAGPWSAWPCPPTASASS